MMSTLHTERLILRPFREADHPAHSTIWAKTKVTRFLSNAQLREDCIHFEGYAWAWGAEHNGFVPRAVVERRRGRLLGHIGVRISPDLEEPELHVLLDSAVWGRGYATEGLTAMLDDAFRTHGLEFILGVAAPENGAAIRVFEKLGFQPLGQVTAWGAAMEAYRLDRP